MMNKFICCLILLLTLYVAKTDAQTEVNYAVHANIIYRFTRYIDWPGNKKSGDFIIGIVGNSRLYDELKTFLANKTVGSQKIVLRQFSASLSAYNCHILFVSEDAGRSLKKLVAATENSSVLLVSEGEGLTRKGSCINFGIADEHLRLEINKNNIEERDLNIASELLSLAVVVK